MNRLALVVLAVSSGSLHLLVTDSGLLPSRSLGSDEVLSTGARRFAAGLVLPVPYAVDQIGAFGGGKDGVCVAYTVCSVGLVDVPSGYRWIPIPTSGHVSALPDAHLYILGRALSRFADDIVYRPRAFDLLPDTFTLADVRAVYESLWRMDLDWSNFRRKLLQTPGLLVDTGATRHTPGRPATLYTRGLAKRIDPPFSRPALAVRG